MEQNKINEAVIAAFNEEVEDITDPKTNHALRMKFGLSQIVLVPTEKYAILKEQKEV